MKHIALYSALSPQVWLRQTPNQSGIWNNCITVLNSGAETSDFLFVYDNISTPLETRVPKERRVLFLTEPPEGTHYRQKYLRQFGVIISPYPIQVKGSRVILSHSALPWYAGLRFEKGQTKINLDFERLVQLQPHPASSSKLSVVTSQKKNLLQQRKRLALIEALKKELKDDLVVFGRKIRDIPDKMDAIYGIDFHLVLENNLQPHFWTEKLADSLLGWAHPIYIGAPGAPDYFPAGALTPIDISDVKLAATMIAARIHQGLSNKDRLALAEARHKLIYEYNLFAMIDRLASEITVGSLLEKSTILLPDKRPDENNLWKRTGRWLRSLRFWKRRSHLG